MCTMDLMPGNTTCDAAVEVYCTAVGETVELYVETSTTPVATTICMADAGVPMPYMGRASFATAPFDSLSDFSAQAIEVRQTVDRLTGTASISVMADCVSPTPAIGRPTCGSVLNPAMDEDPATPEFEYRTIVLNTSDPDRDVLLEILSGGSPVYSMVDSTVTTSVEFPSADYTSGGTLEVRGTVTDAAGNIGVSPMCTVTVEDLPSVTITAPMMGQVLGTADDCGDPGYRVAVTGTTDAAAGSTVTVIVPGQADVMGTVGSGGTISECVPIGDGSGIVIEVQVDEAGRGVGTATVTVTVDTMPPPNGITDLAAMVMDARAGIVTWSWTDVDDAGGGALSSYEFRCSSSPITNETEWMAANLIALSTTPGSGGTGQMENVSGFPAGTTRHCAIRGVDAGGALTPLEASVSVTPMFQTGTVTATMGAGLGAAIAPIGDVNGDGIDDVLVGGEGYAYLYYGSDTGLGTNPDVVFHTGGGAPFLFGTRVAGLGDINGDLVNDFAIADPFDGGGNGAVYIIYGLGTSYPTPAPPADPMYECNLTNVACAPDVVIRGESTAILGFSIAGAGDFDGDGLNDVMIGAPNESTGAGRTYIVRGSASLATSYDVPSDDPSWFVIDGPGGSQQNGNGVTGLGGDVTGDGRDDVAIGAPGLGGGTGLAYLVDSRVYTGSGLMTISDGTTIDSGAALAFGISVYAAGDIDGDGAADLAVYNSASSTTGRVHLYTELASGGTEYRISNTVGSRGNDQFGNTVGLGRHPALGTLGDLDGDTRSETIIGSNERGSGPGSFELFYNTGTLADRQRTDADLTESATMGERRVQFVGDVNGDGHPDIGIGEPTTETFIVVF